MKQDKAGVSERKEKRDSRERTRIYKEKERREKERKKER